MTTSKILPCDKFHSFKISAKLLTKSSPKGAKFLANGSLMTVLMSQFSPKDAHMGPVFLKIVAL